ncbi:unnamed protein product [Symbiodinium pilosum]|uniref:SGNH hydrolase-type esterase domain-containing protein n=1 Tax=Symbiodinium pilosum TaxID=2952 RepID=A0A812VZH0_SYMPI|nr:unnamed protein product [Symbiodinium pilosum]
MTVERYQLLGDSSLYVKTPSKKKKPLKGDLEQMMGGPTEVTYQAGAGAREILQALKEMAPCKCLGISYFGNDILRSPLTSSQVRTWEKIMEIADKKAKYVGFVIAGSYQRYQDSYLAPLPIYDKNLWDIRRLLRANGFNATAGRDYVDTWAIADDKVHFASSSKKDLCRFWALALRSLCPRDERPRYPTRSELKRQREAEHTGCEESFKRRRTSDSVEQRHQTCRGGDSSRHSGGDREQSGGQRRW